MKELIFLEFSRIGSSVGEKTAGTAVVWQLDRHETS